MKDNFFWLDYTQKNIWREWLAKMPHDRMDVYYDPEYVHLYVEDHGSANCYIYNDGEHVYIYPFIMRPVPGNAGYFDISAPYGYGGPVSDTDDPDFLNQAYRCFNEEALKRNVIAEVIKFHSLLNNHIPLMNIFKGTITKICPTVYVDINVDEDYRWKNIYTHANRKNINKAKRSNIEVKATRDDDSWRAFQRLYAVTMDANKTREFYFFSPEYFNSIKKYLAGNYILISCTAAGRIIAVMLVLLGKIYAHCHLLGTDRDFMSTGVNNLLHHELILWCKKNGYLKLHIGGGRGNSDDDSLLRFKKNFSDKLSSFYVGEYVLNPGIYSRLCREWSLNNPGKKESGHLLKYRSE